MQLRYSFLNKLNNGKMKLVQASLRKQLSTKGRDCQFTWKRKRILLYMNADESFLKRGGHIQMRPNTTSPRNSAFFMVSDLKIQIEWLLIQTSYEEVASSSKSNTQTFQYQIVKTLKLIITITRNHLVTIAYFETIAIFSSSRSQIQAHLKQWHKWSIVNLWKNTRYMKMVRQFWKIETFNTVWNPKNQRNMPGSHPIILSYQTTRQYITKPGRLDDPT